MYWVIILSLFLCSCSTSSYYEKKPYNLQEDSITWEYDKTSFQTPSSHNFNNNILDSQDGSVQKGNPIGIRIRY
jgi:PBP1b-binding outer membrane lipoprotein LpoB